MLSAVIIDDEPTARNVLRKIIAANNIPVSIVGEAGSVKEGAELLIQLNPDLILLDVVLGKERSFDMLRILPEIRSKIIFVSGFEQFAIDAFKFSAIDYILKPVDGEELMAAIQKAERQLQIDQTALKIDVLLKNLSNTDRQDQKIVLQTHERTHIVQIRNILRCESSNNYTEFHLKNGNQVLISKPIKQYDELLGNYNFFRVHKSHLVNMDSVVSVVKKDGGFLELINGDLIPISSRKKEKTLSIVSKLGVN